MASRRILEDFRLLKTNGDVCTDGVATIYLAGTTTPASGYSDKDLSQSGASVKSFDSAGYPPNIFISTAISVKVVITGDAGNILITKDYYAQATDVSSNVFDTLSDPGSDKIGFWDESANAAAWLGLDAGLSISGTTLSLATPLTAMAAGATSTLTVAGVPLRLVNSSDAAANQGLKVESDRATPAANDTVYVSFLLSDSAGTQTEFGRITSTAFSVTDASETGLLSFSVAVGGVITEKVFVSPGAMGPVANDGCALGSASLMWSDLFLASGGVINFNNGNVTITHSAAALAVAGAAVTISGVAAPLTLSYTDAGAAVGPEMVLDRNSASPAASDLIGQLTFRGRSSTAVSTDYARIWGEITDPTNGSTDGRVAIAGLISGFGFSSSAFYFGAGQYASGATGGDKGIGTINASAVYDDNSLLTCFVLEYARTGKIDLAFWDALSPTGKHEAAHRFWRDRALLDIDAYMAFWRENGHLPGLPSREEWKEHARDKRPIGEMIGRLWQTVEMQAVHIAMLRDEMKSRG